ncbi:DUF4292 domain-containing protein [Hufsiella ginkgonis]|uniref:DUF4292 domain-containing protein n=1 Tax=Hufsiella ginkgonis TaxID=2695274 RepID=A0A7K1Y3U9_9SPHI|nr:DUF4292 domain-containing protein [Hufsiella ginkgonis]MXV17940.1 DUF4292 domain-containing protein [Hufsiella ginkgonis]
MKRDISTKLFLCLLAIALSGCKAKQAALPPHIPDKPVVTDPPLVESASRPDSSQADKNALFRETVQKSQLSFNTLSFKAKGSLSVDGKENDVTMNIRIRNEKAIWVSVTAVAGLTEIARVMVTPDSVLLINRYAKEYLAKPFSYLHRFAGREITFGRVQAIMAGNILPGLPDTESKVTKYETSTLLAGLFTQVIYTVSLDNAFKVTRTELKDPNARQSLLTTYADFSPESGQRLHHAMTLQSSSGATQIRLDVKYSKVNINEPVEMPFSIPKRFTIVD